MACISSHWSVSAYWMTFSTVNTKCLFLVIKTIAAHCAEQILYDVWQIFISVAAITFGMYFHSCLSTLDATLLKIIFTPRLKSGFHICVSRTHGSAKCLPPLIYEHQCSQTIPASATKAYPLASKSHKLNFSEWLWGLCRNTLQLQPMETKKAGYRKYFRFFGKKDQN